MPENNYRALQRHLDRMPVGFPPTESGVEIRILQQLFTPEQASIALCLSAVPETVSTIHHRLQDAMPIEDLQSALGEMAERGLIERGWKRGQPQYGKSMFVVGIYERQVDRLTEELERDILKYFDEVFGTAVHSGRTPQLRTVPIHRRIVPERGIARYDDLSEFVRRSEGPFAVMHCVCRQGKDLVGSPCRQTAARENCLTLGAGAVEMMRRGVARFLDHEEVFEVLEQANEDGLVLEPQNTQNPLFVCCCCGCCCGVLTTAKKLPRPAETLGGNYYADVDRESCTLCGTCHERCPMEAVTCDAGTAQVNQLRCIGCGLCVSSCPAGALQLMPKPHQSQPPKDTAALYSKIFRERFGALGTAKAIGKSLLGLQV